MNNDLNTIIFPNTINAAMIRDAVRKALADEDFMGNNKKVKAAEEALTPKSTVTATFKRLQGNAYKDFLAKKDKGQVGYIEANRDTKIMEYVKAKFQTYIDDAKTTSEANKLFNAAYPPLADTAAPEEGATD